jgi:hypothetical protein
MATYPIKQLTKMQRLMGGIALFKPHGSIKWTKVGPTETAEFTPNITTVPVYTNEFGDRRLLRNITTTKEGTVALNGLNAWTEWVYEALYVSKHKYLTQAAVTDGEMLIEEADLVGVYEIPGKKGAVSAVTDGAESSPIAYVLDQHYTFHPATGVIEILSKPDTANAKIKVAYTLPAITEADKLIDYSIMETSGTRGEFRYIGLTTDGLGTPVDLRLFDVEFLPNGAASAGDTANVNTASLTGSVYTTDKGYGTIQGLDEIIYA